MLHKTTFHSTLKVFDLEISTTLWKKLMFDNTVWVLFSFLVTLVEVVEGKRTSIRCLSHYNYLWWNSWSSKEMLLKSKLKEHQYSIIIFLILTSWTKNLQYLIAKFMTFISQLLAKVWKKGTQNTYNNSCAFNIHFLSNIFVSVVQIVYCALNVWQMGVIYSTT